MWTMTTQGSLHADVRDDAVKHLVAGTSVDLQSLPGSGRSVLTQAIAAELEDSGWQVIQVHGVLALRERPLEALAVAGLMARQGGPQGPTTAVSAAVQGILGAVRGGSTLMVVDDVDDLDEISAGAIAAAHTMARFPMLTTSRHTPRARRAPHRIPVTVQPGVTLTLPPLGYVDTQTLLVETLGGPIDSQAVSRVFAASGGLPGLALPLVAGARQHGSMRLTDGVWTAGPDLWSPEMMRAVDPLLQRLSPEGIDGLHALSLAGTVDVTTARRLMSWEVLEELDGYRLLRFVPRDDEMIVSLFPLAIVEYFRHLGVGARHLKVDQAVNQAFGGEPAWRVPAVFAPWRQIGPADAGGPAHPPIGTAGEADVIMNRLLHEHWHRELLVRRTEWERTPTPAPPRPCCAPCSSRAPTPMPCWRCARPPRAPGTPASSSPSTTGTRCSSAPSSTTSSGCTRCCARPARRPTSGSASSTASRRSSCCSSTTPRTRPPCPRSRRWRASRRTRARSSAWPGRSCC